MSVILGSEIARLVFGYLQGEQLEAAATEFCKTSPYLVEEYDWLQRGYKAYKICDLFLVDIIREHCEIKYAVDEYIETLPLSSLGEALKIQNSLSGKVNAIIDLVTNTSKPNSRKRSCSTISSTETTQSNDLHGYEPPLKERRLILHRHSTPKPIFFLTSTTLKQNAEDVNNVQVDKNTSPDQVNIAEKYRHETSHHPIFTETILKNTQFQNVLVDNINRNLETHDAIYNNNSLQEQVKHAIDNIILSTEQDPTFQQVLDDVVKRTAIQEQSIRTSSINDNASKSIETIDSPVPLKQRLCNRSHDEPTSSCTQTPGVRLMKDYDSLINFPELRPLSQSSSQKDGSSYNRATNYKPDESDDIDENIEVLIKENGDQIMTGGLGVDPHQNIIFNDDQLASENEESDSSSSTSPKTSSTSSHCSSAPSTSNVYNSKNDASYSTEANKMFVSQRTQNQLKSTPELVSQASSMSRATLIRELFGDETTSYSDFMDTPNKTKNVPVSKTKNKTSTDSITVESKVKKAVTSKVTEPTNLIADIPNVSDSIQNNLIAKNIDIIKCNERNATITKSGEANEVVVVKDSSSSEPNSMEPIAEASNVYDASLTNSSVGKSIIKDPSSDFRGSLTSIAVDLNVFVTVANSSFTKECDKVPTRTTNNDSISESDDDNDDYDDCTLISSLPISNSSNRIYHSVISDTQECAMKLTTQSLDMRPVATYFNGRKIVMRTCDGVILYSSAPKTHSPPISSGAQYLSNKRENVKFVHGGKKKLDVEVKVAHDETDSSAPEKNARYNIFAISNLIKL